MGLHGLQNGECLIVSFFLATPENRAMRQYAARYDVLDDLLQ